MCKHCEELLKCPVGEKRKVLLIDDETIGGLATEMVLDRYPDMINTFIHTDYTDIDGFWHNVAFKINYCPICGEKLI